VWLDTGLLGLAVAYLLGPLVAGVLSLVLVHRRYFTVRVRYSPRRFLALLNDAKVLGLQLFVMNLGNNAENLLVPKMVGITAFGNFAAGTLLPRRLEVVSDGLNTAFYPVLARGYRESRQQAAATVKKLVLFMSVGCVPVAIGLVVLADPIAHLLFPDQPDTFRTVIRITAWWVPLIGLAYAFGYALNAAGHEKDEAKMAIIGTLVSLVVSVVLITRFGLVGACVAMVAKAAIGLTFRLPYLMATLRSDRTTENRAPQALEQRV
jgi:O-antigen/teichoic acid export membrane protein